MVATIAYLSHLPPGQTTFLMAVVPGVILLTAAFSIHHVMSVISAQVWRR